MTSILDKFEISSKIPQIIKINIKSFFVFNDSEDKKNIIFVTKADKVYGLGNNSYGVLGFGHNHEVEECTEIEELSNKKITKFFTGSDFILGKSEENLLLGWGRNDLGQLGTTVSGKKEYLKPQKIEFWNVFGNPKIKDICCGSAHTLVLLTNGVLYGWGCNSSGQLVSDRYGLNEINSRPMELTVNKINKFKYIYCCGSSSFAITTSGKLIGWGSGFVFKHRMGLKYWKCIPREVELSNITEMCLNYHEWNSLAKGRNVEIRAEIGEKNEECFVMNLGYINESKTIININCGFYDENETVLCDSENIFHSLVGKIFEENIEEKYESIFELFAKSFQITPQTVGIPEENVVTETSKSSPVKSLKDDKSYSLLDKHFEFISDIGSGGFGAVKKYWNNFDQQFYAIKVIELEESLNETFLREVRTMASIKTHFIVQYYNSWYENNQLFIQMELCFDNLINILKSKPKVFQRNNNRAMNSIEFFISCEIFRQITKALNYLHSLKPKPLIHRDLKPENILIGIYNNRSICKLADFGLSKFIENHSDNHTRAVGTQGYRAPEVRYGEKYDQSCDIFSLGVIGAKIFNLKNEIQISTNEVLVEKLERCDQIINNKLLNPRRPLRISSSDLLIEINEWCSIRDTIKDTIEYKIFLDNLDKNNYMFFYDILSE